MYYDYYGFQDKPFNQTPDPRFIFLSENHREAIAHLLYGINNHVGFISITGEVGSGKTTVLRSLLSHLEADQYRTALIFNPALSPSRLLRSIAREFGILPDAHDSNEAEIDILEKLNSFLIRENAEKRTVILVIDEAQNLSAEVLEQIRLISNLETDSDKLIQIILSGQPELLDLLKKRNLRQLNQRITVRYHLKPLDFNDTMAYMNHRVEIAKGRVFFSRRAVAQIFRFSGGLPRLINAASDRALLAGYTRNAKEITGRLAATAIRDLARQRSRPALMRPIILYPLLLVGVLLAAMPFIWDTTVLSNALPGPFAFSKKAADSRTAVKPPVIAVSSDRSKVPTLPSTPEKQIKATPVDLNRGFLSGLEKLSENESLRSAFNEAALLWKVEPAPKELDFRHFQEALQMRELSLYHLTGKLNDLKQINCPAVLEFVFPGKAGKRYAALIGFKGEKIAFGAQRSSSSILTISDVEKYWTGHAYVPWKNFLQLPERLAPGSRGKNVQKLQKLLRETGIHIPELTKTYDRKTQDDVKIFQASYRLEPNGIVDSLTLLILYRSIERFETPRLKRIEQP